jgi:Spy/CpxP family protein refolding chaperone
MNSRRIKSALILFGLLATSLSMAQGAASTASDDAGMNEARTLLSVARKDILREELRLSEEQAAAFWPVYYRYQTELQVVRDRFAEILGAYSQAYRAGTVSEEQASQLIDDYLDIQSDVLTIKKSYLKDFRDALPARMAARFYQIDNKIEIELEYQLSLVVPLIDPV